MRQLILLLLFAVWLGPPARAQVTLDLRALDSLPHPPPAAHPPRRPARMPLPPTLPPPADTVATTGGSAPTAATGPVAGPAGPSPAPAAGPARVGGTAVGRAPEVPPPAAAAAPAAIGAPPALPAAAPPPLAMPAGAPPPPALAGLAPRGGPAASLPAPLTLPFPPGKATLTAAQTASIAGLVRAALQTDATSFSVLATAAGSPQNPSAARRLALARALAVHDALRAAGVPGSRIFLRAAEAPVGADPPDRAVLRVSAAAGTSP